MKTQYPISRVIGTGFGLYALWILVELLRNYLVGPQRGYWVQSVFHFSWLDEDPTNSVVTSAACLCVHIAGAGTVWVKPRMGSFLMGMGWLSHLLLSFMSSVPYGRWEPYLAAWAGPCLLLLIPALWYFRVCVKDEAAPLPGKESG